jgi:elongation factor 1-alpha
MYVAINQMDATTPPYDKARYEQVKADVHTLAKSVGYKDEQLQFLPVSAFEGDNIKEKKALTWWTGDSILKAIDKFTLPEKPTQLPLRWPIQDVYSIKGVGTVPVGKIECGIMKPGQQLIFKPSTKPGGVVGEVKTIEMHHEAMQEALPGDNIGFVVRGVEKKAIARGDVLGHSTNVPTVAKEFTAQLVVLNHPTVVTVGYSPVFHLHTAQVSCRITEIQKKLNPATGEVLQEHPDFRMAALRTL